MALYLLLKYIPRSLLVDISLPWSPTGNQEGIDALEGKKHKIFLHSKYFPQQLNQNKSSFKNSKLCLMKCKYILVTSELFQSEANSPGG